ncbi:MAG: hypothetical protein NVSMB8_07840 [Candidatus Limnocylindrales bacterium]
MLYFYEIHDGDEDLGSAVLVCHPERQSPAEFFALVKRARDLVKDSFEESSLSEAIATELERAHGFLHVTDERLIASVNVGETDKDTFLVAADEAVRTVFVAADADGDPGDDEAPGPDDEPDDDRAN